MTDKQAPIPVEETNEILDKAIGFWSKNSKLIIYAGAALLLSSGAFLSYKYLVQVPKEEKSADAIFPAEHLFDKMTQSGFNKDTINIVLNGGNGITTGILKIAAIYSGTDAGNRANLIAGACYLHNKEFDKAVTYLSKFSTPATQVQTAAYSMLGDAYAELNKNDEALTQYKKAASVNKKDEFMTSEALYKAASFAEAIGKSTDAIELFKENKEAFPKTARIAEIEKHLARLGDSK
jgi:tetratricopeptide (TPR) repeat protein